MFRRGAVEAEVTGKIDGVCHDRFGDFDGFDLHTEHGEERRYRAREGEIERLVLQAWRERWVVTVVADDREHGERDDRNAPPWVARIIPAAHEELKGRPGRPRAPLRCVMDRSGRRTVNACCD